jgi:hypothetical protein
MVTPLEAARANPMAPPGATVAADQDFRGAPRRRPGEQSAIDSARGQRHAGTGAIFQKLDRALHQQTNQMRLFGDDQALRELASAFRRWALTNVSRLGRRQSGKAERQAAEAQLIASLVAFLRARYP